MQIAAGGAAKLSFDICNCAQWRQPLLPGDRNRAARSPDGSGSGWSGGPGAAGAPVREKGGFGFGLVCFPDTTKEYHNPGLKARGKGKKVVKISLTTSALGCDLC